MLAWDMAASYVRSQQASTAETEHVTDGAGVRRGGKGSRTVRPGPRRFLEQPKHRADQGAAKDGIAAVDKGQRPRAIRIGVVDHDPGCGDEGAKA